MDPLLTQLAGTGVTGLIAALFILLYVKQVNAHLKLQEEYRSQLVELVKQMSTALAASTQASQELVRAIDDHEESPPPRPRRETR